ncbi:MAG TPA: gluconeogenesis factor YvcK family protein [Candidatus Limnocylindrales bacterium]|nr:gluconeogenesis factor YvcK family protein [Candidatus Limnocylindrales bacterium]
MALKKVVSLGGSSGPRLVFESIGSFPDIQLTAIVATTDTGSSTGIIRKNFSIPAPGDLRATLALMADPPEAYKLLKELFEYRLQPSLSTDLRNMAFGNLFITALAELLGDFDGAIQWLHQFLQVRGKVLPVSLQSTHICAELEDGSIVKGEYSIRQPHKPPIKRIFLEDPEAKANPACLEALHTADLIVIGPGCLYTSQIACLVFPGIVEAIQKSSAKKVYICNTTTYPGQTDGFTCLRHVEEIMAYLGKNVLHYALINQGTPSQEVLDLYAQEGCMFMDLTPEMRDQIQKLNIRILSGYLLEPERKEKRKLHKLDTIRLDPGKVGLLLYQILTCKE